MGMRNAKRAGKLCRRRLSRPLVHLKLKYKGGRVAQVDRAPAF
jgi:hypothetical protein